MTVEVEFASKPAADSFRADHPDALCDRDDKRLKTVRFTDDTPDWLIDSAETAAFEGRAERQALPGESAPLSEGERRSLDRQHRTWTWQQHGFEAMRAKGALQSQGTTEWMDFYEPGEGAADALQNLERSKGQAAETGAPIGVGGDVLERDPDDPTVLRERGRSVARGGGAAQCNHAEDVCRRGDPDACEFLGEACGFDEAEIDAIVGIETDEPVGVEDLDVPFTGPQLGALRRSWGGYKGAITDLEAALADVREAVQHATDAIEAVNAIRTAVGQDPLEPERLNEIREMDLAEVCERRGESDDPLADFQRASERARRHREEQRSVRRERAPEQMDIMTAAETQRFGES